MLLMMMGMMMRRKGGGGIHFDSKFPVHDDQMKRTLPIPSFERRENIKINFEHVNSDLIDTFLATSWLRNHTQINACSKALPVSHTERVFFNNLPFHRHHQLP